MKDEFKELEVYMKYYISQLYLNTRFMFILDTTKDNWKYGMGTPTKIIDTQAIYKANFPIKSFEEFQTYDRKFIYE